MATRVAAQRSRNEESPEVAAPPVVSAPAPEVAAPQSKKVNVRAVYGRMWDTEANVEIPFEGYALRERTAWLEVQIAAGKVEIYSE